MTSDQTRIRNMLGFEAKSLKEISRITQLDETRTQRALEKLIERGKAVAIISGYRKADYSGI